MSDSNDDAPPRTSSGQDGCPGTEEVVRSLVERLRARRADLAAALGGRALSVEVVLGRPAGERLRLGFAGEGYVTRLSAASPLVLGFSPDVVILGSASDVCDVLTADEAAPSRIELCDPDVWPRYARVQRIVAAELRAVL